MDLIFNVFPYYVSSNLITYTPDKISITPKLSGPQLFPQFRKFLKHLSGRYTLQYLHYLCRRISRRHLNKYMHVVFHDFHRVYSEFILLSNPLRYLFQVPRNFPTQYMFPVLRYPHKVVLQILYGMFCLSCSHATVIPTKAPPKQASLPRLTASHFSPASLLAGIQWSFL